MKWVRTVAALLTALTLTLTLAATPASAGDTPEWGTGGSGGGGGDGKGTGGHKKPGGGGSGSGSGGGSVPDQYWSSAGTVWGNPASKAIKATAGSTTLRCSGGNGFGKFLGMRWKAWGYISGSGSGLKSRVTGTSKTCIDSPHYVYETRRCVTKITGSVSAVYSNAAGAAVKKIDLGTTRTPFESSGRKAMSQCSSTFTKSFTYAEETWGQYKGEAVAFEVVVTLKRYITANARTGVKPATQVVGMTAERRVNPVEVWWTQSCSRGVELGRANRNFSGDGCKEKTSTSEWKCVLPSTAYPYVDGVRNNQTVDVFHDGKKRGLVWGTLPTVTGDVRNLTAKRVRLNYVSGTPFRAGAAAEASNQHFSTSPVMEKWVTGWNANGSAGQTGFTAQFFKAGLPGKNLRLAPIYGFEAEFNHRYAVVTGISSSGKLTYSTRSTWATSTATCPGVPTNLAIVRARISN